MFSAIFSRTNNNMIGKNNKLLVKSKKDFAWFISKTTGNTIIMGGSTYRSIGRPLPNRRMVVLSRDPSLKSVPYLTVYDNVDQLLENENRGIIIGGATVWNQLWPHIETVYETVLNCELKGDTEGPNLINFELKDSIQDFDLDQGLMMKFNTWQRIL